MEAKDHGACRYCGVQLIDWGRVHTRSIDDTEHTFDSLKREFIRHALWHKPIDKKAELHARRKGRVFLRDAAANRLRSSVGLANPYRDGQQTPMEGNILYYAQHATASCCRTCIEYWHNIPKGRELTDEELAYFTELIMRYVADRMPALQDDPEKIPRTGHGL
jgi:hypothetical protein